MGKIILKSGIKFRSLDENITSELSIAVDMEVNVVGELTAALDDPKRPNRYTVFKGVQGFHGDKLFCAPRLIPLNIPLDISRADFCPGHAFCETCGECIFCTYPHKCCCGKCGWNCDHDHSPRNECCHAIGVINHSL